MTHCVSIRRLTALALTAMLLVGLVGGALAQENQKVVQVDVAGNQNINTDTIRSVISLKPGDEYSVAATEKDKQAIMQLGTFSAVTVHKENVTGGVKVVYEVTENPKITAINVIGNGPIPAPKIQEAMKTKVGTVLNSTTINQDIESIQAMYADEGYVAYVTEDIDVNPKTGVLTVPILVHTVESVEVTGNKKTKSYVFLREMKTKPGSTFNRKVLNQDIINIYNLDILEDVKQPEITPGKEPGLVRIVLPVVEKKTGQVSVGLGYSSKQRLVGQARLSETNFRGTGQGLNLLWEQGTSEAVGGNSSYELGWVSPWIDKQHTSLSVSAYSRIIYRFSSGVFSSGDFEGSDEPYNERHSGGDVTVSRPVNDHTRIYLGGRFETVDINTGLLTTPVNNAVAAGSPNLPQIVSDAQNLAMITNSGPVAVGSLRLVNNTRDFDLDPATGGYNGVTFEFGGSNGSRFNLVPDPARAGFFTTVESPFTGPFEKMSVDIRRYFSRGGRKVTPQDKRVTLALRLRAGFASGSLPFYEQFFVGGSESLRGYVEDRFWGNKMLLVSAELRKPLAQSITGVLFADYGDAWGSEEGPTYQNLSQTEAFAGNFGVGVGMRVTTPIGHLRLDYGIGNEGARTHFSMGQAF